MVDYFKDPSINSFIILRHDIDKLPENALAAALVESELGIRSTYYFRSTPDVFDPDIIEYISTLGHEIGYHYECLTTANGDYKKAIEIFEEDLSRFRKLVEVRSICMHGSPLSKWNNSHLWKRYNLEDHGIIGEPYVTIDYKDIVYFTDTGRTWCKTGSVRDFVSDSLDCQTDVKTTDDLIEIISAKKYKKFIILAHPQRWSTKSSKWLKELVYQNIKNVGKDMILKRTRK
jgi:hypothetical protein